MIQTNVIDAAYRNGCKKLLFLGSSCIYPKFPKIPITEDQLLASPLEESNSAYAIAKIAGSAASLMANIEAVAPGINPMPPVNKALTAPRMEITFHRFLRRKSKMP